MKLRKPIKVGQKDEKKKYLESSKVRVKHMETVLGYLQSLNTNRQVLKDVEDGEEHSIAELVDAVIDQVGDEIWDDHLREVEKRRARKNKENKNVSSSDVTPNLAGFNQQNNQQVQQQNRGNQNHNQQKKKHKNPNQQH